MSVSALDDIKLYVFHHHHYLDDSGRPRAVPELDDRLLERAFRPRARPRALRPAPADARPRRPARLRRHRDQRAPQHGLQHEPLRQPARRAADGRDAEREDHGRRDAREPDVPESRRGGVRDARRDVGRANGVRVPPRHGHGVLVEREHDQPDDGRGPLPRVARRDPSLLDRGRADPLRRSSSTTTASSTRGRSRTRSRTRSPSSSAPAARRRSRSQSTTGSATRSSSCRSRTSFGRLPACASSRRSEVDSCRSGRPDHRRHGLRRRHRRAGSAEGAAALREVLQLVPPRDAASSSSLPAT